jgi:hypothetical protein
VHVLFCIAAQAEPKDSKVGAPAKERSLELMGGGLTMLQSGR